MKKYVLIVVLYMPYMQGLTIINKSELPAIVTQVTLQMHDGLEKTASIKQTHIPIAPQTTVELAKQARALTYVMGLTVTFNNTEYYFTTMPPHTDGYIIIENTKSIQVSPEVIRVTQEQGTLHREKNSSFGPHLI